MRFRSGLVSTTGKMSPDAPDLSWRQKLSVVRRSLLYRPLLVFWVVVIAVFAAILEGIGLSFLLPVISLTRDPGAAQDASGALEVFVEVYQFLGVPFSLEFVILGASALLTVRYSATFVVAWIRSIISEDYKRHLQEKAYEGAMNAEVRYFDQQGSDDILNTIVTESTYGGRLVKLVINLINLGFLVLMYLAIAFYISPLLTVLTICLLGGITYGLRWVFESGSSIGDRVAEANQKIHESAQSGVQGIRDVKLFGLGDELRAAFDRSVRERTASSIKLYRNKAAMNNFYNLVTAVTLFVLIYLAVTFANLSLEALGVFLFTVFRLSPKASSINDALYNLEGTIPHLHRTQHFLSELDGYQEHTGGIEAVPDTVEPVEFDDVWFRYDTDEQVFTGLSFTIADDEFVAFVGPSGAGKSTIAGLLTRMYDPDRGEIRANGTPISNFDVGEWREKISVVRQHPFIFNDTLERNVTIANRDASQEEVERVCEIAQVTEFLPDLPAGYETKLGEEGVRLSGGQKQRVALARALLKEGELLILDEATSDLDANIEEDVHRAIEEMDRDYAMLVIAHRLSTVLNADRIYAVKDGRILESGTHDELIQNEEVYADLYETQANSL